MLKRIDGYTKAELIAGAADESLDFPAGAVAVPSDSSSELFFFLGNQGRMLGLAEGTGVTTFVGLTDTAASLGTAGQKVVVNSAANALEFTDALQFNLSGSGYSSGRVLQANGSEYVDILSPALPEPSSTGVMFAWDDTTDTVVQVAAGTEGDFLGVSATGLPEFESLEPFLLTGNEADRPTKVATTNVNNAGDKGVDWDFEADIAAGLGSGIYFCYVSANCPAATLDQYPESDVNRYYMFEVYRSGELYAGAIGAGTTIQEGQFYLLKATRMRSGTSHLTLYVQNVLGGTFQGWREINTHNP
jgi:hypothetical protein